MDLYELAVAKALSGSGGGGGGGGDSSYTLLGSAEYNVAITSSTTTAIELGTINVDPTDSWSDKHIIYIRIRRKEGIDRNAVIGMDYYLINLSAANQSTSQPDQSGKFGVIYKMNYSATVLSLLGANGSKTNDIYYSNTYGNLSDGKFVFYAKYNSSTGVFSGTYQVDVFKLKWPNNISPFDTE